MGAFVHKRMIGLLLMSTVIGISHVIAAEKSVTEVLQNASEQMKVHSGTDIEPAKNAFLKGDLKQARTMLQQLHLTDPDSADVNYYLALVYKEMLDYQQAEIYLMRAVRSKPDHGDAHSHLGELFHAQGKFDHALKELKLAELHSGRPAYTSYLLGQVYMHAKEYDKSIRALQYAMDLDYSFTQKAEYSKGIAYYRNGERKRAETAFQAAIFEDPGSDVGVYAKLSLKKMQKASGEVLEPFRMNVRITSSYDDNVALIPPGTLLPVTVSRKSDYRHTATLNLTYLAKISQSIKLDSAYQLSQSFHHRLSQFNVMGHTLSLSPTYVMKSGELGVQGIGDYYLLNNSQYLRSVGGYLFYRFAFNEANSFSTFRAGVRDFKYYQAPVTAAENRDSRGFIAEYNHLHMLNKKGGYISLGLSYTRDNTKGDNWDNQQYKIDASISYPLFEKVTLDLYGSYVRQDFIRIHTIQGIERLDNSYNMSTALTFSPTKHWLLDVQYSRLKTTSNISLYRNARNIYSLSIGYLY